MEPVVKVGNAVVGVGAGGTLLLGIWLPCKLDSYALWDGWILAALVLWILSRPIGQRTGVEYTRGMTKAKELQTAGQTGPNTELLALNRTTSGVVLHALA